MLKTIYLFLFVLLYAFTLSQSLIGVWKTPKAMASIQYKFEQNNRVVLNFLGDITSYSRTGNYRIVHDTVFISYDSLAKIKKQIYYLQSEPNNIDTLFIVNANKLRLRRNLYLYNREIIFQKTFEFSDTLFNVGQKHITYSINYDLGKPTISSESYSYLDSIYLFLNKHPALSLEIGNHQDSRASSKSSSGLSLNRAKAIVDYLVSKGVDSKRLTFAGYGEAMLLISDGYINDLKTKDEKEKAHQQNRRTEFKILKIER